MARIRTIKPEAFVSESLAEVSVEAERTFVGLLTQADDHGRHRDNAAIIAGLLWPLRAEHTSVHVEDDLQQLADAGLICRYTGCDGRRYLHIVTWSDHQKIDKPSQSRMPSCPHHDAEHRCGPRRDTCTRRGEVLPNPPRGADEASPTVSRPLTRPAGQPAADTSVSRSNLPVAPRQPLTSPGGASVAGEPEAPARAAVAEGSPKPPRNLTEPSAPGSRTLDPGPSSPTGRTAPDIPVRANQLVGEYIAACAERPPGDVLGHLGRTVKKLLCEGIAPEHVRAGLKRFAEIQGHPSRLPSLVNDAMNARSAGSGRTGTRHAAPVHAARTTPADPAAYVEEL